MAKFILTRTDNLAVVAEIEADNEDAALNIYASRITRNDPVHFLRAIVDGWISAGRLTIEDECAKHRRP